MSDPKWITDSKPEDENWWCVIDTNGDYQIAYWVEGTGCWDCPDIGWIEDKDVNGWFRLPPLKNEQWY